jgi:hypothetical protein
MHAQPMKHQPQIKSLEPSCRMALPDMSAGVLKRTQQLTRYDDAEFTDLEKDKQNIAIEQAQQIPIMAATGNDGGGSIA